MEINKGEKIKNDKNDKTQPDEWLRIKAVILGCGAGIIASFASLLFFLPGISLMGTVLLAYFLISFKKVWQWGIIGIGIGMMLLSGFLFWYITSGCPTCFLSDWVDNALLSFWLMGGILVIGGLLSIFSHILMGDGNAPKH